jgi:hypothetical protein
MSEREMPRYSCHKEVHALKIAEIVAACGDRPAGPNEEGDGGAIITPADEGYGPFRVDFDYVRKHNPYTGGYFVVYKDGYKSFSPPEPFEQGYTLIQ